MDSPAEHCPRPGRSPGALSVPSAWVEEYDGSAEAERLARLAADETLMIRVRREGFKGRNWYVLCDALAAYGNSVIKAWVAKGWIFQRCRDKGLQVKSPPADGVCSLDIDGLVEETVAFALARFTTEVLKPGIWDPARGASLTTFFIGMCLKQFPTTYTDWLRRRVRESKNHQAEMRVGLRPDSPPAPDAQAMAGSFEEVLAAQVPEELTQMIVRLRADGYANREISELLGITIGTVESRLHRLRNRVRQSGVRRGPRRSETP